MIVRTFVLDVAVIMIPVEAAKWKFRVNFTVGFYTVCVLADSGHQIMDFLLGNFAVVVHNFQIFGFSIPLCKFNPRVIEGCFNPVFAHDTVTKNFEIGFDYFALRVKCS